MSAKFLATGAIVGGATLYAWGALSHMVIPWPGEPIKEFRDATAVARVVRDNASENGVYLAMEGIFASVDLGPNLALKTDLTPKFVSQFLIECLAALVLCLILLRARTFSVVGTAGLTLLLALAAGVEVLLPEWNWYGFSTAYTFMELADLAIGWFLAGLVLGSLKKKMVPEGA